MIYEKEVNVKKYKKKFKMKILCVTILKHERKYKPLEHFVKVMNDY